MKNYIPILTFAITFGCTTYQEEKIDPVQFSKQINDELNSPIAQQEQLNFEEALKILAQNNKELKIGKLNYSNSQAVADLGTPFPNPEITLGGAKAFNFTGKTAGSTQPFIDIAFLIPLNGRLSLNTRINQLEANKKLQDLITIHRDLFFQLRNTFTEYSTQQLIQNQHKVGISLLEKWLDIVQKNKDFYSELEITQLKLELAEQQAKLFEEETKLTKIIAKFSQLLYTQIPSIKIEPPNLNQKLNLPPFEEIWQKTLENNRELNSTLLDYAIAEKKLELEIRKQYPDLKIGSGFNQEPGEDMRVLSFSLGIDLPIFDQNQVAIKEALNHREEIKQKYLKQLADLQLNTKRDYEILDQQIKQIEHFRTDVMVKMNELVKGTEKAVQIGELSFSRYLEFKIRAANLEKQHLLKLKELLESMNHFEAKVGVPFFTLFKSDSELFKLLIKE